jgi:nucleoside diphosphate kinase
MCVYVCVCLCVCMCVCVCVCVCVCSALLDYITSGPVVAMELLGEDAISKWRNVIGPTDPSEARQTAPNSIRARFGHGRLNRILSRLAD